MQMEGNTNNNNWRPAQMDNSGTGINNEIDANNWRNELSLDSRHKIVNKIMDTLQRHMPPTTTDGMTELNKIALRFEEKIYTAATNQQDYLRKISLKMLSLETKGPAINPLAAVSSGSGNPKITDPAHSMQSQLRNQGQTLGNDQLTGQIQARQQLPPQNMQSGITAANMQSSAGLPSALSSMTGLSQTSISDFGAQSSGLPNITGISQSSMNNSAGQVLSQSALLTNAQRLQMQARQQQQQHQQQTPAQQHLRYQQQALLQQKLQQQSHLQPSILQQKQFQQQQSHLQQHSVLQQQSQLQSSQQSAAAQQSVLQSAQQAGLQQAPSSVLQPAQQSVFQQSQQSASHTSSQFALHQHQQSVLRQQQSQQQSVTQQQASMVQQPILQSQQQQQQLMGQQNNTPNMQQQQQHQLQQMLQQAKAAHQHQTQQASQSLLQPQSQQSQQQSQKNQQILSQLQSSPQQLSPQPSLLQQPNSNQQEMQQRLQTSGGLLQPQQQQNTLEQQKQQLQTQQRGLQEASSTSMDSSGQTGQAAVGDWQEKVYQKLQSLKEMYYPEIKELYTRLTLKCQQPMATDQFEKLKHYKNTLQRMVQYFQVPKNNIPPGFKEDKVHAFEKQIIAILNSLKQRKSASQQQQGQQQLLPQTSSQVQPLQQQSQPQISQAQQQDKHVLQPQQLNSQASGTSMQHGSVSLLQQAAVPTLQQNAMQPGANFNALQGTGAGALQQSAVNAFQQNNSGNTLHLNAGSTLQHNSITSLQQSGMNPSQQSGMNASQQNNINSLQSNANTLQQQKQALKQQQEQQQQFLQAQQFKQQMQQRQIHHHLLQQQQQQQIHQQQQKQQHASPLQAQLHAQQTSQAQLRSDVNSEAKAKQAAAFKQAFMQMSQRSVYQQQQQQHQQQQQFNPASSLSASSPQLLQAASPQISQQFSPQIDQQSLMSSSLPFPKVGTPLQHASSPSTLPAPSPLMEDGERHSTSIISSISNAGSAQGLQQSVATPSNAQSLAIGTPGISASPLLGDLSLSPAQNIVSQDGSQIISPGILISDKSTTAIPPFERLVKMMNSMSPDAMNSAVSDISSVVSLSDRMAGSAPGNGSRAAVGEDLVAMTKCRLQARNILSLDGCASTKKMRRCMSSMPLSTASSGGSLTNTLHQLSNLESSEMQSTATSTVKRPRLEVDHVLQVEIRELNQQLVDTVVDVSDNDMDASGSEGTDGIVVKCTYNAIALGTNMKSGYKSTQMV
eukprot:Gb_13858 [translate_table: standard]